MGVELLNEDRFRLYVEMKVSMVQAAADEGIDAYLNISSAESCNVVDFSCRDSWRLGLQHSLEAAFQICDGRRHSDWFFLGCSSFWQGSSRRALLVNIKTQFVI